MVSLAICLFALVSLFVIVNTFTDLSNVTDKWRQTGKPVTDLIKMLVRMNVAMLPVILYDLLPVITLASAMFTVVALQRSNEITPLLASGVSIYRILWPIFLMGIVLTLLQVADKEILIPKYADSIYAWVRIKEDPDRPVRSMATIEDGFGNIVSTGRYLIKDRIQEGAYFTRYYKLDFLRRPMVVLNAARAVWVENPQGWRYVEGTRIDYDTAGNVANQRSFGQEGFLVPLRESSSHYDDTALVTDVTPVMLESEEVDLLYRPSMDLLRHAREHGMRPKIAYEINKRMAAPLGNIVLLLIGLPFVLKREVKSPFLAIVMAVCIAGAFLLVQLLCENFAVEGQVLTPLAGAWTPIIIFGPIGVLLFDTVES